MVQTFQSVNETQTQVLETLSTLKVSAVEDEGSAVSSCHENRGIEHSFQYSIVYGIYYFEIQQFSYFESGFFRFFDLAPAGGLLDW